MNERAQIVLTGDRPTGRLHLGHYVGSLKQRVKLQNLHNQFVMIADTQALTDHSEKPDLVRDNVLEVALDNMSVGVDPAKTTFLIQSTIRALPELALYFLNLVTLARLERNPTVKEEVRLKGYGMNVPAGFFMYPVSQAADILAFKSTLVPVGDDQLPMIEQANEIGHKFNSIYGEIFQKVQPLVTESARLPGIDGKVKMGKSLGNAIYLSDSEEVVKEKVMQMYTDPDHIHVSDSGKVEGNMVFTYLDVFDSKKDELSDLKNSYTKGGLGDVEIKRRLAVILNTFLDPIREERARLEKDKNTIFEILKEGSAKANLIADATLNEAKRAMKINYF
ncbi:MAG: tryptophan--tRNA ligase [Patescibacteria group bacterium]